MSVMREGVVDFGNKRYIKSGGRALTVAPHSEVCMHLRVAGKVVGVEYTEKRYETWTNRSVQLYTEDWQPISAPVGVGEAGLYQDQGGTYYYAPQAGPLDFNPSVPLNT